MEKTNLNEKQMHKQKKLSSSDNRKRTVQNYCAPNCVRD